jgi:putative salt-induced outer membrane protein YdiY
MLCLGAPAGAVNVVVDLRNGDRLTGQLIAQETNHIVVTTSWGGALEIPIPAIGGLRTTEGEVLIKPPSAAAPPPPATPPKTVPPPKPVTAPVAAPTPNYWKAHVNLGLNLVYGAKDSQLYYGTLSLNYERPYKDNPKKFFRNVFGYAVNYGETQGTESANNMGGTAKTDFDVGDRLYVYNQGAMGYDTIRKIDLYYSIGPGLGYHLYTRPKWVMNLETGLSYQVQERSAGGDVESFYLRVAEDATWKISKRTTFTQKYEFFQNCESFDQFRFQLNANLSYALWQGVSLNLTALDLYDTDPAPGVDNNELQIRTSLGITF